MDKKQRFFVFDRTEYLILLGLGVMISIFSFTLGLHLGKKQAQLMTQAAVEKIQPVETLPDASPGNIDLSEQSKGAEEVAAGTLQQELQAEVVKTGIKLDKAVQVELPKETVSEKKARKEVTPTDNSSGKYTLQVGSYSQDAEAQSLQSKLKEVGLESFVRKARVQGSDWYRVFVGGFESIQDAKVTGDRYVTEKLVDSFVVAKMPSKE